MKDEECPWGAQRESEAEGGEDRRPGVETCGAGRAGHRHSVGFPTGLARTSSQGYSGVLPLLWIRALNSQAAFTCWGTVQDSRNSPILAC